MRPDQQRPDGARRRPQLLLRFRADRGRRRGTALAKELADAVQHALPAVFERKDDLARENPATFFSQDGYPHIRVSFNVTPGDAPRRVTLLVGP